MGPLQPGGNELWIARAHRRNLDYKPLPKLLPCARTGWFGSCAVKNTISRINVLPVKARTMTARLLGIDVGTGGTRAVLLDETGRVLGAATAEHAPMSSPKVGWAEQEPRDWWRAACSAIREWMTKAGASGGGLSGLWGAETKGGVVAVGVAGGGVKAPPILGGQRTSRQVRGARGAGG